MRDVTDNQTGGLEVGEVKRGRGRPRKADAMTNAQRQAAYRARRRSESATVTMASRLVVDQADSTTGDPMGNYTNGLAAGMAARNAAIRDGRASVADWDAYSKKLQGRLNEALGAELNEYVERKVSVDYVRALRKALAELVPDHPLLKEEIANALFEDARVRAYAERGYAYNVTSGQLKRV